MAGRALGMRGAGGRGAIARGGAPGAGIRGAGAAGGSGVRRPTELGAGSHAGAPASAGLHAGGLRTPVEEEREREEFFTNAVTQLVGQALVISLQAFQGNDERSSLQENVFDVDEEEHLWRQELGVVAKRQCTGLWWVKPRCLCSWDKFFMSFYDPARWKKKMRMVKSTFLHLCSVLAPRIEKQNTRFRNSVPVQVRLGLTLQKLFKNSDYSDLADKFGVGESTAHEIFLETTRAIVKILGYKIHFPENAEEVRATALEFQRVTKTRLPNVVGAIDCTHFEIIRPAIQDADDYFDRKQRYSVVLQAVCDARKRFTSIYAGWPGSVHDMRVYRNSSLQTKLQNDELLQAPVELAFDDFVKPYIVGDKGYQLQKNLQIPYSGRNPTAAELDFNLNHHLARIVIEQAFGLLKMKFRCLDLKQKVQVQHLPDIIAACCILHNFLIDIGDSNILEEIQAWRAEVERRRRQDDWFERGDPPVQGGEAVVDDGDANERPAMDNGHEVRENLTNFLCLRR